MSIEVKEETREVDHFYHLGLDTSMNLEEQFGNVKFVLMGGSAGRMTKLATRILKDNTDGAFHVPEDYKLETVGFTDRFTMYKLGPIICVSHGMGIGSISICLHEVAKLLRAAKATDYTFVRIGSSGGVGVDAGSVVVSTGAINDLFEEHFPVPVFGKLEKRPCPLDEVLAKAIAGSSSDHEDAKYIKHGKTMGCTTFYESQARLDGAIENKKTLKDKAEFLQKCVETGVVNLEMESTALAAFCHKNGIPGAIVCVTLLNRLNGDQISFSKEMYAEFNDRPIRVTLRYVKDRLAKLMAHAC